jgi:hypothetical protein
MVTPIAKQVKQQPHVQQFWVGRRCQSAAVTQREGCQMFAFGQTDAAGLSFAVFLE